MDLNNRKSIIDLARRIIKKVSKSGDAIQKKVSKKISIFLSSLFILVAFINVLNITTEPSQAGTVIPGGSISSDTTWTKAGSPYWVEDSIVVNNGVTLTIEPGVTVKFKKQLGMHLYVDGNLIAIGTPEEPINFTSNASSPASKDWGNLWINSTGSATVEYCNITYGNVCVGLLYASNCIIKNNTFMNNEEGVVFQYADFNTIQGNVFYQNVLGIVFFDSDNNTIIENNISSSSSCGIYFENSKNNEIYHNNIIDNPVQAYDDLSGNFWDDGYPSGGNYWSDWSPITDDLYDGAVTPQTTGSPDGICDVQYDIDSNSADYYPLKYPFGFKFDKEPPTIENVSSEPDIQNLGGFVNISANITDNKEVSGVWINITDPLGGTVDNTTMNYSLAYGKYFNNSTYDLTGTYIFTIWTNDANDNWNSSHDSFLIKDSLLPSISNVAANPGIQDVFTKVNISAKITDNYNLSSIWINISCPNGSFSNTTMNVTLGNVFFLNQSYEIIGDYDFTIWANDTSNNWNFSLGSFTIEDNSPPSITGLIKNPDPQEVFGTVNISCSVIDDYNLLNVSINITDPEGISTNKSMDEALGDIFYFEQSFIIIGVYDFTIWANDSSGNWNFYSDFLTIKDHIPPSIDSVASSPNTQDVFGDVNISAIIDDNYGLYEVRVNISCSNGSSFNYTMDQAMGNVFFSNRSYDGVGDYDFVIWVNDTSNNWNFALGSFTIKDDVPPTVNDINTDPDIQEIFEYVNITALITDNYDLFDVWINITLPNGSWHNVTMNESFGGLFYHNQSYDKVGDYNFTIWVNDTVNNWNFELGSFTIWDPSLPESTAVISSPYWKNVSAITISWSASDNLGLANITLMYRFSPDNSNWYPWEEYSYNNTISGTSASGSFQFIASEDGYYEFFVNASDIENNWEPDALSAEAKTAIDTFPPSSSVSISPYWNSLSSLIINIATGDDIPSSGIKEYTTYYRYSSNNISWSSWEKYEGDDREGYYEFYSIAIDNAGNMELKSTRDALCAIDNSPPTAEAGEDRIINENTSLSFDGSGSTDNFWVTNYTWAVKKDFTLVTVLYGPSPSFKFDIAGDYSITLTVKDPVGNTNEDTITVSVEAEFVDLEAPEITHSATPSAQEVYGSVNITTEVTDNVKVYGVWVQIFDPQENEIQNVSMVRIGLTGDYFYNSTYSFVGAINYTIWVNDSSDNWAKSKSSFEMKDTMKPEAEAGENLIIKLKDTLYLDGSDSTDNFMITNYTWNITKDGVLMATLYGMNPNYKFEKAGNYEITLTVKDSEGNVDDDTITVQVKSPEPNDYWWLILIFAIVVGIIIIVIIVKKHKKKTLEETPETSDKPKKAPESLSSGEEEIPQESTEEELPAPDEVKDESNQ